MFIRRSLLVALCVFTLPSLLIQADNEDAPDLYGHGVHAYYEGQFEEAAGAFSQAIEQGTNDPRIFYFRGLSHFQLGDEQAGRDDLAKGAQLENESSGRFYGINKALTRVQGPLRLILEEARDQARREAAEQRRARNRAIYGIDSADPPPVSLPDPVRPKGQALG